LFEVYKNSWMAGLNSFLEEEFFSACDLYIPSAAVILIFDREQKLLRSKPLEPIWKLSNTDGYELIVCFQEREHKHKKLLKSWFFLIFSDSSPVLKGQGNFIQIH